MAETDAKRAPPRRAAPAPSTAEQTLEDRLAAKAARGDVAQFTGPSLDEMAREERHKLLYGE